LRQDTINCRELVGMAIAKRATGRNWRQVRDDLLFYVRGRGAVPQVYGDDEEYRFVFPGGQIFYHRATGEYGYDGPVGKSG
jgi:hypothetical protein